MSHLALYRQWRPQTFADVVGQYHVVTTLKNAITHQKLAHAYLFAGPRGTGKTTLAKLLAKAINCEQPKDVEPCNECPACLGITSGRVVDVVEMDAASNRGVDEIRSLLEQVRYAPTEVKHKVYIIDEVHMLTGESFNALLKTLEEPPEHVVFILATTDAHKLPATIISRTQRFQFQPINPNKVTAHLKEIAKEENISVDDDALALMAAHGQGSFRDSISLLDQAANYAQPITADTVNTLLGIPPLALLEQLLDSLTSADRAKLVHALHQLFAQGYPAPAISSQLSSLLRQRLINGETTLASSVTLDLLEKLLDVSSSASPELYLEICLLKSQTQVIIPINPNDPSKKAASSEEEETTKVQALESKPTVQTQTNNMPSPNQDKRNKESTVKIQEVKDESSQAKPPASTKQALNKNSWVEVLNLLKSRYNTLYGVVRMASTDFSASDNTLTLKFAFPFHQKRVNDLKNRKIIQDAIYKVCGQNYTIECIVDKELLSKSTANTEDTELEAINSIFGGGEIID